LVKEYVKTIERREKRDDLGVKKEGAKEGEKE
jgi:hypothetical protein